MFMYIVNKMCITKKDKQKIQTKSDKQKQLINKQINDTLKNN